jgi:hypothetical protein
MGSDYQQAQPSSLVPTFRQMLKNLLALVSYITKEKIRADAPE